MKTISTLRNLFLSCNLMTVYTILYHKQTVGSAKNSESEKTFNDCMEAYKNVVIQMLMKPISKKKKLPLYVSYVKEQYDNVDESYYSVNLLNTNYEEPPAGHYNANLFKYNKFFGLIADDWAKLIDADVIVDQSAIDNGITNEQLVTEILWEITFYGFTEKKQKEFVKNLKATVSNTKKSIIKKKK